MNANATRAVTVPIAAARRTRYQSRSKPSFALMRRNRLARGPRIKRNRRGRDIETVQCIALARSLKVGCVTRRSRTGSCGRNRTSKMNPAHDTTNRVPEHASGNPPPRPRCRPRSNYPLLDAQPDAQITRQVFPTDAQHGNDRHDVFTVRRSAEALGGFTLLALVAPPLARPAACFVVLVYISPPKPSNTTQAIYGRLMRCRGSAPRIDD